MPFQLLLMDQIFILKYLFVLKTRVYTIGFDKLVCIFFGYIWTSTKVILPVRIMTHTLSLVRPSIILYS